jgi:hypothetical protein
VTFIITLLIAFFEINDAGCSFKTEPAYLTEVYPVTFSTVVIYPSGIKKFTNELGFISKFDIKFNVIFPGVVVVPTVAGLV